MKLVNSEKLKTEVWKDIPEFPYQISNYGRIRTNRPLIHGRGLGRKVKHLGWRQIKHVKLNGYPAVSLRKPIGDNLKKTFYIHRLLWEAFVGPIPKKIQLDHINRDRADSRLANLRLATSQQNNINRVQTQEGKYRGVSKGCDGEYFTVYIRNNLKKKIYLGCYKTAEEAAMAYNEAALRFHGQFAVLNKIIGKSIEIH